MTDSGRISSRKARPAALLNVVVLVWLSIAFAPCTLPAATPSDIEAVPAGQTQQKQPDCHGNHIEAQPAAVDCCCDPLVVSGGEDPKTQRVDLLALTILPPILQPVVFTGPHGQWSRLPAVDDDGPPVYLATQRLRI